MRSFHLNPDSKLAHKVDKAGERLNSLCLYLIPATFFSILLLGSQPYNRHEMHNQASYQREVTEDEYLIAVSSAKQKAPKLSEAELQDMDMWAAKATNPEDVRKMKPKAKATYYASLRGSVWEAIQ